MKKPTIQYRYLRAEEADFDEGERKLSVSFSSETPVLRRTDRGEAFYEVLSHDEAHADLSMLQNGGAFLDEHMNHRQIGSVDRAWIDKKARKGRASLLYADTSLGNERLALALSGNRRDISCAYQLTKELSSSRHADGKPIRRFAWKAYEISSVAVGADHFETGYGRSTNFEIMTTEKSRGDVVAEIQSLYRAYLDGREHLEPELRKFFNDTISSEEPDVRSFKRGANDIIQRAPQRENLHRSVPACEIGMNRREVQEYSIARAMRSVLKNGGKLDGPEADYSRQCEITSKTSASEGGFLVPADVLWGPRSQRVFAKRDMIAGDFGSGGAFVPDLIYQPTVEILRNRSVCSRAGITHLGGLSGNLLIPKQTAASVAKSVSEIQAIPDSQPVIDQIRMVPHRVGATTTYSRQLVIQSAPDVERFILDDLMKVVALKHDALTLVGQGEGDEPLGVFQQDGISKIIFGAAASWTSVVSFETQLGILNADQGTMSYITTPKTKGKWKTTAKTGIGVTSVVPIFLWEDGNWGDGSNDGKVNGYRAISSNQIPNDQVLFWNAEDVVQGQWGGFELILNPYSLAKQAEIIVVINSWIDVALRHAASICVSTDSGAQ